MQKYVETSGPNDTSNVNEFFAKCQKEQSPYILIEKARLYATVRWDYIAYTHEAEEYIKKNQSKYLTEFDDLFNKYKNTKSKYYIGHGLAEFYEIQVSKSHEMASELHDIIKRVVAPHN